MFRFSGKTLVLVLVVVVITLLFSINLFVYLQEPVLISVSPVRAVPGDVIIVRGRYLGQLDARNTLYVGAQRITSSSILEWESDRISFRMPRGMSSGSVRVVLPQGGSNQILLTNTDTIPQPVESVREEVQLILTPLANSDESFWRLERSGQPFMPGERIYFASRPLDEDSVLIAEDGTAIIYISTYQAGRLLGMEQPSAEALVDLVTVRSLERYAGGPELAYIDGGVLGSREIYLSADVTEEQLDHPLFVWDFTFPAEENGIQSGQEYFFSIPLPRFRERVYRLSAEFDGLMQITQITETEMIVRIIPGVPRRSGAYGTMTMQFWGTASVANGTPAGMLAGRDNYQATSYLPGIYQDYIEEEEQPVLSSQERSALSAAMSGVSGALPMTRAMIEWFRNSELDLQIRLEGLIDELRIRDIGSRKIYRLNTSGDYPSIETGLEVFFPRWGWVAIPRESLESDVPMESFADIPAGRIDLPVDNPFPELRDSSGDVLPGYPERVLTLGL